MQYQDTAMKKITVFHSTADTNQQGCVFHVIVILTYLLFHSPLVSKKQCSQNEYSENIYQHRHSQT